MITSYIIENLESLSFDDIAKFSITFIIFVAVLIFLLACRTTAECPHCGRSITFDKDDPNYFFCWHCGRFPCNKFSLFLGRYKNNGQTI